MKDLFEKTLDNYMEYQCSISLMKDDVIKALIEISASKDLQSIKDLDKKRELIHFYLEYGPGWIYIKKEMLPYNFFSLDCCYSHTEYISKILGRLVPIDLNGTVIKAVTAIDNNFSSKIVRGHMTSDSLSFHSDRSDLTLLNCYQDAMTGGELKLVSSLEVISFLRAQRKDYFEIITHKFPHDMRNEGKVNYIMLPILSFIEGNIGIRYIRKFTESVSRYGVELTAQEVDYLDAFDYAISQCEMHMMLMKPTDLCILNNHIMLHARNAFDDSKDKKRMIYRTWINSEYTRQLISDFLPIFGECEAGANRGGIYSFEK